MLKTNQVSKKHSVSPNHVLQPAAVKAHQHKVLELRVHWDRLVVLRSTTHIYAVLSLAVGDDACEQCGFENYIHREIVIKSKTGIKLNLSV